MRHYLRAALISALLLGLAACGTKGALTLPPGPAKPPLFGNPATDKTATPAAAPDTNTAKEPAR